MTGQKKSIGFWILAITGAVLLIWHAWYYYPFIADDSFISFRYGERLLQGKGLSWNDGRPVEGYSNLLWILLLALAEHTTHWPWWIVALALSLTCTLLSLYITLSLTYRLSGGYLPGVGAAMAVFVVSPPMAIWISGGLEAPLLMLLLITSVSLLFRASVRMREIVCCGFCVGLLSLTRPDGIIPAVAIIIAYGFLYRRTKQAALAALIMIMFYLGQLIFRLAYYHQWVSNTALAKIGFSGRRWKEGLHYAGGFLFPYLPFLLLFFLLFKNVNRQYKTILLFLMLITGIEAAYTGFVGGDFFPGYRLLLPMLPFLCLFAAILIQESAAKWRLLNNSVLMSLGIAGGSLLMLWYQARQPANKMTKADDAAWHYMAIGTTLRNAFPSQSKLATGAAGVLPFISRLPTLDMLGLNDAWLTHHKPAGFGSGRLAHELGDPDYYLRERPDIVVFSGYRYSEPWLPQEIALFNMPEFGSGYLPVNAICILDEQLPFPLYGFPDSASVRIVDTVTLYLRRRSPCTGTRFTGGDAGRVPVYFLQNETDPGQPRLVYPDPAGKWVTDLQPGESGLLSKEQVPELWAEDRKLNLTALTLTGDSLSVTGYGERIRVSNQTGSVQALKELRLSR